MPSHRMPKQLLFGRIEGARRARHGLEKRWSDVVQEDVELSGLADDWYQRCQDRPQWRRLVKDATGQLEAVALQQQRRAEERRSQQRAERRVAKAQQVGTVGGTGGASASHLGHLGQSTSGTWVCPVTSCQRAFDTSRGLKHWEGEFIIISSSMKFTITIVRHGETTYNRKRLIQGQGINMPLSDVGFEQAAAVGAALQHVPFTCVYSSDQLRAQQTAEEILKRNHHCRDHPLQREERLRERSFGASEGCSVDQLRALAKEAGQRCPHFTPPGGETLEQLKTRLVDFFLELCSLMASRRAETCNGIKPSDCRAESDPGAAVDPAVDVLVVTHGGLIREWVRYLTEDLGCPVPAEWRQRLLVVSPNTGVSRFLVSLPDGAGADGGDGAGSLLPTAVQCLQLHSSSHLSPAKVQPPPAM
ncbi:LOW QUALITY PROTEIN: fructose-2,6-bisphosphatase TIGAR-like [Lethenteron reissneri]|uniref:LOW QUALITY PROTEIN: fructose-2,6-bisphosphatase TIGAR-like n=1 Tax=Lethenteron reissneri TaxID=7753 RepID=UPI002AB73241|nr:LOW QUALITY PROTEIN: fructose-2,6-bisphosphatase TIGAR-like [Lethenteron reissneri]